MLCELCERLSGIIKYNIDHFINKNSNTNDPLLRRFISDVFLFEDIPAGDRKPDDIYLGEVRQCDIYIAILGNEYGLKNDAGKSATELEFDEATRTHRERLVFVKGDDDSKRSPEMAELVRKAGRLRTAITGATVLFR